MSRSPDRTATLLGVQHGEAMKTYTVSPARFASGCWSEEEQRRLGEGDIARSYSGDSIATSNRVRRPFQFQNRLWVQVGSHPSHDGAVEAYQIVKKEHFQSEPTTYGIKTRDANAARNDPNGFYHGMTVQRGDHLYVLAGPPVVVTPEKQEQADLSAWS